MSALKHSDLLAEQDLKDWLNISHRPKLEQWLSERGIPFEKCRGEVVTTIQAINAGIIGKKQDEETFSFE